MTPQLKSERDVTLKSQALYAGLGYNSLKFLFVEKLIDKFVHANCQSSFLELLVQVGREAANVWTIDFRWLCSNELKDLFRGLGTIHLWHRVVHQDELIVAACLMILILEL